MYEPLHQLWLDYMRDSLQLQRQTVKPEHLHTKLLKCDLHGSIITGECIGNVTDEYGWASVMAAVSTELLFGEILFRWLSVAFVLCVLHCETIQIELRCVLCWWIASFTLTVLYNVCRREWQIDLWGNYLRVLLKWS